MSFASPMWLWCVPVVVVGAVALTWWHLRRVRARLAAFVAARWTGPLTGPAAVRRWVFPVWASVLVLVLLLGALARPQGGPAGGAGQRTGVNLMIVVDGSHSMQAEDVVPTRFGQAQSAVDRLLARVTADRVGLMLFAGDATLMAPLSFDTISLQLVNRGLDLDLVGKGGSSPAGAIRRASELLSSATGAKVVLVISDGEETEGDAVVAAQEAWQKRGVRVFTAGVGRADGAVIPRYERTERRERIRAGTVHDAQGAEVRTRLDARLLELVAAAGGGSYLGLADGEDALAMAYEQTVRPLAGPMETVPLPDRVEWFQVPVGLALILWAWAHFAGGRWRPVRARGAAGVLILLLAGGGLPGPAEARAAGAAMPMAERTEASFRALQQALLTAPEDVRLRYNYAVGAYAVGRYAVAADVFEKLAEEVTDPAWAARCRAQAGNCRYRQGEALRTTQPEGAIRFWTQATEQYGRAGDITWVEGNRQHVREALVAVYRDEATRLERKGDEEARLAVDKGIPAWRQARERMTAARALVTEPADASALTAAWQALTSKIVRAYVGRADEQRRRAERQRMTAPERAIETLEQSLVDFDEALALQADDGAALAGKAKAGALLEPWMVALAQRQQADGATARPLSIETAMGHWQKAAQTFAKVLARTPTSEEALAGQRETQDLLFEGWLAWGEQTHAEASRAGRPVAEADALRETALGHYQAALALRPGDARAQARVAALGEELVDVFVARGSGEFEQGKALVEGKPTEAIAWVERAVQSLGKALRFAPAHADARKLRTEAEALLKQLRAQDAEGQRKVLAQNKTITDPQAIEDPGKLALKLLDYESEALAGKKPQDFSAPENTPLKDW